jgi:hypothetical protein
VLLRGLVLWYFRITEMIEVLKEIRDRLPAPQKKTAQPDPAPGFLERLLERVFPT